MNRRKYIHNVFREIKKLKQININNWHKNKVTIQENIFILCYYNFLFNYIHEFAYLIICLIEDSIFSNITEEFKEHQRFRWVSSLSEVQLKQFKK